MSGLHLDVATPRGDVRAVALVLHGGRSKSLAPTRPWQLAVVRMAPFAKALRRADDTLAVARLRYRVRGWNETLRSPVPDATAALDQLAARFPGVPIALVGHSMGGRTALYTAGHAAVRVVVGLAPWVEPGDEVTIGGLAGRRLLIAHGADDRMTDPSASAAYTRSAAGVAASASYVRVEGDTHAMLRRAAVWHQLAAGFVVGALAGPAAGTAGARSTNNEVETVRDTLAAALAGRADLVV